jgi:hypothetical protein
MEEVRLMSRMGDETFKYDPKDPDSVKDIKKQIKTWLDKGYYFFGAKAGEKKMKRLTKFDDIDGEEFDRFILSAGTKKVLSPPPMGG